jgi:hypothetical protein
VSIPLRFAAILTLALGLTGLSPRSVPPLGAIHASRVSNFDNVPWGVDEILVYVLPVLLGDGVRFSSPGLDRIDLEPLGSTRSGAVTILRFRVLK